MDTESREITAFSSPTGHYEWLRCPVGLRSASFNVPKPSQQCFCKHYWRWYVRLPGQLNFGIQRPSLKHFVSHLQKFALVLKKLIDACLKLNLPKCNFLKSRIEFLGHVDRDGIHTNDTKIHAVKSFSTPRSFDNVLSFLGLARYYRAFVKDFSSIASPPTRLLKTAASFCWHDAQQQRFNTLR